MKLHHDVKEEGKSVCLIDDDKIQHFYCEKSLQLQGLSRQFMSFFNVEEALMFFNQHLNNSSLLPDIIFLDLNMTHLNGWEFLQRYALIKEELKKNIKIYILTSSINREEMRKAESIPGVSGFISKPLKPDELNQILKIA